MCVKIKGFQIANKFCTRIGSAPVIMFLVILSTTVSMAQRWTIKDPAFIPVTGERDIIPQQFVTYNIDEQAMRAILWQAPDESLQSASTSNVMITVGLADGSADIFRMVEYEMMEIELAATYPNIRTYRGISISNPYRTIRADWTENGFRAVIRDLDGTMYIDPFQRNDLSHCIAYYKKDFSRTLDWACGFEGERGNDYKAQEERVVGDCVFRSYRLAVATTGEYSNFFGATSAAQSGLVLSQVITAVNRVNDVFEVDAAVRLILIGNTASVFYYVPATDPFSGDACTQLGQNQTNMTSVIGSANYDIGHVFSVGSGGCAGLGVICLAGNKARGATGLNPPTGDPFYIDYVAHELGHQFGGNHTQNNNCNRNNSTAMEPGSASTIMGYAGICAPDVQNNSDAYLHGISLQEFANEIASENCHLTVSSANAAPVLTNVPNYTIPKSTPFVLTATATDPDGDPLTYCWEQWDEAVGTMPPVSTNTVGPMFRSLLPTASPSRYFYNLTDLTNNVNPTWEELPSVSRTMDFRVTVRDLHDGMYGCTDEDNTLVTIDAASGPFVVTSQNAGATWLEGSGQTITWSVANTNAAPVNCASVEIRLSYDGGLTYPGVLSLNEPNDGSANITIPVGTTTEARVRVKAVNNVFFDINDQDIIIQPGVPNFTLALNPNTVSECNDGSVQTSVLVGSFMGFSDPVTLSLLNAPPGAVVAFVPPVVLPGNASTLTISNLGSLFGTYTPIVRGTSTPGMKEATFTINLLAAPVNGPTLVSPANNSIDALITPNLDWNMIAGVTQYDYQVSTTNNFSNIVVSGTAMTDQFQVSSGLSTGSLYYWRVRAINMCGIGPWSSTFSFTTGNCFALFSSNVPVTIPAAGTPTVTSTFSTTINLEITDLNIINLVGTHTWIDDLKFSLKSPANTEILFWDRPCTNHDNFNINFDDEAANMNWPCPPTNGMFYKPNNVLTPFDGQNSGGIWTLKIQDIGDQDGGSLTSWGLKVCGLSPCEQVVTQTSGTGVGTLPGALNCVSAGDTIFLSSALVGQTINLGASPLVVNKDVVIMAQAANINITGNGARPFEIQPGLFVEFSGMIITAGTSLVGGAINNQGTLTLKNVTIEKNVAVTGATLVNNTGGGLRLEGTCSINQ